MTKKQSPSLAGIFWEHASDMTPAGFHAGNQGHKPLTQGELRDALLLALSPEPDNLSLQVNVRERDLGFGKPATLLPRNAVTDVHPVRAIRECRKNLLMFLWRDTRFPLGRIFTDPKFAAWIDPDISELDSLEQEQPQDGNLAKGRVFGRAVALPPAKKTVNVSAGKLSRENDIVSVKVTRKRVPPFKVAGKRFDTITVTVPQVRDNPGVKSFGIAGALRFLGLKVSQQFAGTAGLYRIVMAQLRRFKAALAGLVVKKANPPKGASSANIK